MLIAPLPHFNADMEVTSYWLDSQSGDKPLGVKDNFHRLDEAFSHAGLEAVERIGIEPFTGGTPLFVPLSRMQLLSGLIERSTLPPEQVVVNVAAEDITDLEAANALQTLKNRGHKIAVTGMPDLVNTPALPLIDFIELTFVRFAVFNIADVFVVLGAAVTAYSILRGGTDHAGKDHRGDA